MTVVAIAETAGSIADAAQAPDAVGASIPGVGDGVVVIRDLAEAVQAVITVLRHFAPDVGAGQEVPGGIVIAQRRAGVGAALLLQIAESVFAVMRGQVAGVGDADDLPEAVIGGVDRAPGAAEHRRVRLELAHRLVQGVVLNLADAAQRIGDLSQVAVGIIFISGDRRRRERGVDRSGLVQRARARGSRAGASAAPAAKRRAGGGACSQGDNSAGRKVGTTAISAVDAGRLAGDRAGARAQDVHAERLERRDEVGRDVLRLVQRDRAGGGGPCAGPGPALEQGVRRRHRGQGNLCAPVKATAATGAAVDPLRRTGQRAGAAAGFSYGQGQL